MVLIFKIKYQTILLFQKSLLFLFSRFLPKFHFFFIRTLIIFILLQLYPFYGLKYIINNYLHYILPNCE